MRKHGVKVSVLEPGIFRTAIVNVERMMDLVKASRDKSPPDVQQFYGPGVLDRCKWALSIYLYSAYLYSCLFDLII